MRIRYVFIDRDLEPYGEHPIRGWDAFTTNPNREQHYVGEYRTQLGSWSFTPSLQGYRQYGYQWSTGMVARGYGIP